MTHIISVQANLRSRLSAQRGRSQNHMPPEAADAIEQAQKAKATLKE